MRTPSRLRRDSSMVKIINSVPAKTRERAGRIGDPARALGGLGARRCQDSARKVRRRRLLPTTKTEEKAIAAPAIMGLRRPAAARGRAATL